MIHSHDIKIIGLNISWTPGPNWTLEITRQKKLCTPSKCPQIRSEPEKQNYLIKKIARIAFRAVFLEVSAVNGHSVGYKIRQYKRKPRYFIINADNQDDLTGADVRCAIQSLYAQQEMQGRNPE